MDFPTLVAPAGHGVPGYPITRGQQVQAAGPCICSVCEVGRLSGKDYIAFKDSVTEPVGRPSVCPPRKDPEPLLVCSIKLSVRDLNFTNIIFICNFVKIDSF